MYRLRWLSVGVLLFGLVSGSVGQETKDGWIVLFNGKDTSGWKLRQEKTTNGWIVENNELRCVKPHGGNDILTEQKFTDFELHIEFQATSNSGVYLQGRYEIQVNNDYKTKPKIVEKDGKKIEVWDTHQCGAIYGRIAPSKNMAKPPKEWQSFDVTFHGARGDKGKVTKKARVTLIWNGEKVIDNKEIDGATGGALDGKVTEPGPILLQGDHGKVAFRNIKIRPLATARSGRSQGIQKPALQVGEKAGGTELKVIARAVGGIASTVLRSAKDAAAHYRKSEEQVSKDLAKMFKVDNIDWKKHMVVVVSGGVQRTGGYSVQVKKLSVKDNVLTVHWKLNAPGPDDFVTQVISRPGLTVLTDHFEGEVRFDPVPPKQKGR